MVSFEMPASTYLAQKDNGKEPDGILTEPISGLLYSERITADIPAEESHASTACCR